MTSAAQLLPALARRYRLERAAGRVLVGLGLGLSLAGLAYRAGATLAGSLLLGSIALEAALLAAWFADREHPVTGTTVARHLDRRLPELEESTALLLEPAQHAGRLAARQRQRVAERWDPARARAAVPHATLRRSALIGGPLAVLGAALLALPVTPRGVRTAWSREEPRRAITLRQVDVTVTPPAYTGHSPRTTAGPDLEVEEGSRLTWDIHTAGAVESVWLVPATGDSLAFEPAGGDGWQLVLPADRSQLVRVRLRGGQDLLLDSDDYRLAVLPDRPPDLTVLRPPERSVFAPESLVPVPVEVLATDDYGVDSVTLSATIASGRGEAVRFRRLELPFASRSRRPGQGDLLRTTLDLRGLHLGPGDELYFHVEATDRRVPRPNRARSETVFLSIRDTAGPPRAELAALALGAQPEYFRSERQLIIDTEKLLADQPRLSTSAFRERANDLGADQGLLRLRYGQFLGEEYEEEARPMGGREHAAEEAKVPAPPEPGAATAGVKPATPSSKAADGLTHKHDDAENATLLGLSVKEMLRAAVAAMWQAEGHLRVGEPRLALPWEYRALELIKRVQQDSRSYVQRVGFDPPPVEVDRLRLTGKLAGIGDPSLSGAAAARDSLPAARQLLAALAPAAVGGSGTGTAPLVEAAGRELAPLALADPRLLPLLKQLRQLADSLGAGAACPGCPERVAAALWRVLPPAEPRAVDRVPGASPFARRLARLQGDSR